MKKIVIFVGVFLFLTVISSAQMDNLQMRIFNLKHASAKALIEIANDLKSQDGKVSFDANTNSLIVFDYPANLERIASVIESIDVREKQVEIKVLVVEATNEFIEDIGITAGEAIIPHTRFSAIANLINTENKDDIRTQMMVRTTSNVPAQIQVTTDEIIGQEVVVTNVGTVITSPIRQPIGNFLEVVPTVNNDNTVTVVVRPSVSTLEAGATPSERTILTQAVLNDGDTIAIGGADVGRKTSEEGQTLFGIPLSRKATTQQKKVVMFLTATVVK